jgi:hypothetical protein
MIIVGGNIVLVHHCFLVEFEDQIKNTDVFISFQNKTMMSQEFVLLFYTILHTLNYVKITRR